MSGYGAAPRTEPEPQSDPGRSPESAPASRFTVDETQQEESDEPDWIAAEDRQPRRPVQATPPPPPPAPEPSGALGIARALTVPLAGILVLGILFVVGLMSVLGFGAYQMYGTASAATESRAQLYALLRADAKQVIDQVADPGAQRTELEASYLDWYEAQGEPARSNEGIEFLDRLTEVADGRLASAEGTQSLQEAQQTMRRIRAARSQYERDMEAWEGRADGTLGSIVIAIGIGTGPPR
jgi:hypothetical protein